MFRFLLALALAVSSPALAQSPFPSTVSTKSVAISIAAATTTQLIPAATNQSIGLTAISVVAGAAGNIKFVYGTGTNCGTGTTDLTGTYNLTTNVGFSIGSGIGLLLLVPPSQAVCAVTSTTANMAGFLAYTQF